MKVPNHIAIIPDGNRRWAKAHRLNPWEGHTEGAQRYWEISDYAHELGVNHLTFWGLSYDNLKKRPKIEIKFILKLMESELSKPFILERCLKNKIRARVVGEWREFITNKKLLQIVENLEKQTEKFQDKSLNIMLAYDGQREMLAAVNSLVKAGKRVDEAGLRNALWSRELPDVDLVIRSGGEPHWSAGFMMWQTANSQFYFTDILWPDFKNQELKKATAEYDRRERRLGQ